MLGNLSKTTKIWIFIFAGIVLIGGAMVYYFNYFGKPALFKGMAGTLTAQAYCTSQGGTWEGTGPLANQGQCKCDPPKQWVPSNIDPNKSCREPLASNTQLPISSGIQSLSTLVGISSLSNIKVNFTRTLPLNSRIPFNTTSSQKLGILDFVSSDKDLILNKLIFSFNGFASNERQRIGVIQLLIPQPNANPLRSDIPIYSNSTIEEGTNLNIPLKKNLHIPVEVWLQIEQDFPTSKIIEIMIQNKQAIILNETNVEIAGSFPIKVAEFTRTPSMPRFNIPQSEDEDFTVSTQPPTSIPGVELQTLPREQGEIAEATTITANLASDTPSASNIYPGETKDILKFTLSANRSAEITGITFTKTATSTTLNADFRDITLFENNSQLDDSDELQTFNDNNDNNKIYFHLSKNLTARTASTFIVKAVLKDNVLNNTKFKIGIATPFDIDTTQDIEITGNFPMKSNEFTVTRRTAEQPEEDQRILDLRNEINRLQRELENARQQDQPDSAIADLQNQLRDLRNQMRSAAASCEAQGKFTYQGRCIDCAVEQYVANGGRCQQTQATSRRRFRLPTLAGADIFEIEEGVREEVSETPQEEPATRPVAEEPTLQSTARLASAPEKGDTGPEVLIYIGILGAAHLIRKLRNSI